MTEFKFRDKIKLTSEQRKEVQRYLKSMTVFSEEVILKIVRKLKYLERKIDEQKYKN